jgi:hypothetical protein
MNGVLKVSPSPRRVLVALLLSVVVVAATTSCGTIEQAAVKTVQTPTTTPIPVPSPAVTLGPPRDGASTRDRTALIHGRLTGVPAGGGALVTMRVNRRRFVVEPNGRRFAVRVALELGRNRIGAVAEFFGRDDDVDDPRATARATPVHVTRERGPDTGRLDRATALWVAESHNDVYWLCGEADECLAEPFCVEVSARRVDCPVRSRFQPGDPVVCGVVISVQLRGRRLFSYGYGCRGRWQADRRIFVRADIQRAGRRYRLDEKDAPWLADEVSQRNRYGVPRIDSARDVFIP